MSSLRFSGADQAAMPVLPAAASMSKLSWAFFAGRNAHSIWKDAIA